MSSGLLPPPGVGLMVSQRGGDNDFGDGGGDVVVTDSFLRTIRGETSVAGRARGEGRGGRVGRDEEISLVDDEVRSCEVEAKMIRTKPKLLGVNDELTTS